MHRALIVEDQDLMRLALIAEVKAGYRDCYIAGASTFDAAIRLLVTELFDLVIIDPGLPGIDPASRPDRLRMVERIRDASPGATHVVITGSDDNEEAMACERLGVRIYLAKTGLRPGKLHKLLAETSSEQFSLRLSQVDGHLSERRFPTLVPRQDQIMTMMMDREPGVKRCEVYAEMARKENISIESVQKYYKQARAKLRKIGQLPKDL
nr:response regulator [Nitrosomonas nitrosa]